MAVAVWGVIAPIGVALVVDLVWMGLALGAVLRKLGQSGAIAFVPVMRWVAAAHAARMSRVAVGLARGIAAIGLVAMFGGLVWTLQGADAAPPAARLTLLAGALTYTVGSLVGWVLWIYGSGTIQLRLKAASGLSWVAALSPHIWASILGWGRYSMAGRTDEAARRVSEAQQGPIRSQAVAASSFALRTEDGADAPVTSRAPAESPASPLSPYAPPTPPAASAPSERDAEPTQQAHATDSPPVAPLAVTPFAPVTPPAPAEAPAKAPKDTPADSLEPESRGSLPPGWTATPPERVSPFTPAAPTPPPADMRPLSAPSADDVPTLSAPTLDAASAAIPVVTAAAPSSESPSASSAPSPASIPSAPSIPSAGSMPSAPSAPTPPPPPPPAAEAPADTLAVSPYFTAAQEPAKESEPESAPSTEPVVTPEPIPAPAPEPAPAPKPAPVAEVPVAPAVSPYLAPAPTGEAEPQWLVEARRQAQQQTPAPSAPTPEPEAETAAVPSLLPPQPEPAVVASEAATASAVPDDDADDRTVLAARRRVTWSLEVGADRYELPDGPIVIGRATPGGGADRIGIVDVTRTLSKVHARLEPRGDRWFVTDMGSTNGTVVRGAGGAEIEAGTTEPIEVTGTLLLGDLEVNLTREGDA